MDRLSTCRPDPCLHQGGQHMSQDTERLSNDTVAWLAEPPSDNSYAAVLAREVQASRKLIADLRALLNDDDHPYPYEVISDAIRMIDKAGL